jgi:ferredoxin
MLQYIDLMFDIMLMKMEREIITIDNEKCNGCGECIPNCHEGALQIIDNKAVLVSDLMCDGLGACVGHCPTGALSIEKREASPYNEIQVLADMIEKGKNVVAAHLKHLKDHNEHVYLQQGFDFLLKNQASLKFDIHQVIDEIKGTQENKLQTEKIMKHTDIGGCPGSRTLSFSNSQNVNTNIGRQPSQISHWPIQLHLIQPVASHFHKCDLLVAADCTAFSLGNFHSDYLKNKKLVIACPKLDSNKEIYQEKITRLIDESLINTITVLIMEVPCCGGLLQIVKNASQMAQRKVPVKAITVGIKGEILEEVWL